MSSVCKMQCIKLGKNKRMNGETYLYILGDC